MEKVNKKVLVLGSTGMLGHVLYDTLTKAKKYDVFDVVFRNKLNEHSIICDVTNKENVAKVVNDLNPDIIVNCIGVLIKGSNTNPANAIYINSFLPHYLASLANNCNAKLIHVSTDCVFSGTKGGYVESDFKDALDVYGKSKGLGELDDENHLTIRTSIIGPEIKKNGEGLLHWFLNQKGAINGFTKAFWGGVTTLELSKVILETINQDLKGLINLTNGQAIAKFDMLQLFKSIFNRDNLQVNPVEGKAVDKSLQSDRNDFDYQVPTYDIMFQEMYDNMVTRKYLYKNNYQF
jgi:dTDP-4-dehydrorhamnose reductase